MGSKWFRGVAMAMLAAVWSEVALARRPALAPVRAGKGSRSRPLSRPAPRVAPHPGTRTPARGAAARKPGVAGSPAVPPVLAFPGSGVLVPDGMSRVWPGLLSGKVVVLDPGHGGSASGAVGPRGLRESDLNLWVARELREFLSAAGAAVVMTRVGDTDCLIQAPFVLRDDLVARAQMSNHLEADLFLSCHHNDAPMRMNQASLARYNKSEIYFRMDDDGPSRAIGESLYASLWPLLSNPRSQLIPGAFAVLRLNERPAVLGEPFYISASMCEATARLPRFAAAEATRYLEGMLVYLRAAYDPPRIVRPIDGEVVDRESFPVMITIPPLRTEPPPPAPAPLPAPPSTLTTAAPAATPAATAVPAPSHAPSTPGSPATTATSSPATALATPPAAAITAATSAPSALAGTPSVAPAALAVPSVTAGEIATSPVDASPVTSDSGIAGVTPAGGTAPVALAPPSAASVEPTLIVTIAGRAVAVVHDRQGGRAWARLTGVPNGPVLIEATLVGPGGRFAPVTRRHFMFEMPPASIQATISPAQVDLRYRGPSVLTAFIRDARGLPVADGTPVRVEHQGRLLATPLSLQGRIELALDPDPPAPPTPQTTSVPVSPPATGSASMPPAFSTTSFPVSTSPVARGLPIASSSPSPPPPPGTVPRAGPAAHAHRGGSPHANRQPRPDGPTRPSAFTPDAAPASPASTPAVAAPFLPVAPAGPAAVAVPPGPLALSVTAGAITSAVASLPTSSPTPTSWLAGRAFDARTGRPILKLVARSLPAGPASAGTSLAVDFGSGQYVLNAPEPVSATLDLSADGYLPQTLTDLPLTPAGARRDLSVTPVLSGVLHQHSVIFDADPGAATASFLRQATELLAGTGVDGVWATWSGHGVMEEPARAKQANRTPAELAVTVMENVTGLMAGPVEVRHYHASERGKAIASSIAEAFRRYFPPVSATRKAGGSYFLNNTRATTIGLSFGNDRRSTHLGHDRVAYIVMHGLMRALRPDLPKGRTIAGKAPTGVAPGSWMILGNGDRCRLDPLGQYTFLDVPPGRYTVWFQTEPPDRRPPNRATFWIDVP